MSNTNDNGPFWTLIVALPVFVLAAVGIVVSETSGNKRNMIVAGVVAAISLGLVIKAAYGRND